MDIHLPVLCCCMDFKQDHRTLSFPSFLYSPPFLVLFWDIIFVCVRSRSSPPSHPGLSATRTARIYALVSPRDSGGPHCSGLTRTHALADVTALTVSSSTLSRTRGLSCGTHSLTGLKLLLWTVLHAFSRSLSYPFLLHAGFLTLCV